jgi:hypothetical protein
MESLFLPLRLATDARNLEFLIDLDKNIDEVSSVFLFTRFEVDYDWYTRSGDGQHTKLWAKVQR